MSDVITTIFNNNDVLSISMILIINFVFFGVVMIKKKSHDLLYLLFIELFFSIGLFIQYGFLNSIYNYFMAFFSAGFITLIYRKVLLSKEVINTNIVMMNYIVFFGSLMFSQNALNVQVLNNGYIPPPSVPNCLSNIVTAFSCVSNAISSFLALFSITTATGQLNLILGVSTLAFVVLWLINKIPTIGSG